MSPIVLEYTVNFRCPKALEDVIVRDRSCRTSRLFLKDIHMLGLMRPEDRCLAGNLIADCVHKCNDYIHRHEGYTVCRAVSKRVVSDLFDGRVIAIAEDKHEIFYLMQTNMSILLGKDYKKLMYVLSTQHEY